MLTAEATYLDERRSLIATGGRTDLVNVTPIARRRQRKAFWQQVLILIGLSIALPGFIPYGWPQSLLLLPLGWVVGYGPRLWNWIRHPQGRQAGTRHFFTGSRPVRVTLLLVGVAIFMTLGLAFILSSGAFSTWATGEDQSSQDLSHLWILGLGFIVIGSGLYAYARRLAALGARELLLRDRRPVVLYLRSFADDNLKLRTETYYRPFLVDRLSPFRFKRFEEVIAQQLGELGPVIAVNPPGGITLPPLGAARETLSNEEWRSTVNGWMTEAQLIVIQAAPLSVTEGFAWELQNINAHGSWPKTLLVLPPVPPALIRDRWRPFAELLEKKNGVRELPLSADRLQCLLPSGRTRMDG